MSYPKQLRGTLCERAPAGERVTLLSKETGVCEGTLYRSKLQAKIDAEVKTGVKSYESDELKQARRRIADLEVTKAHQGRL